MIRRSAGREFTCQEIAERAAERGHRLFASQVHDLRRRPPVYVSYRELARALLERVYARVRQESDAPVTLTLQRWRVALL